MAKDLLDKTGLTYLATKFQEWCESLFVKKDTEYEDVYASDRGVEVSIGGTIGSPTISIKTIVGEISANNSSFVSGDIVKAYVDANKGVNTVFQAQTSSSNAVNGLVPAPTSANTQKYLRGDGTWQTVGNREATAARMGYVILDPNKTFAGQVTAENTIYEIRDDFDLEGQTKEIPAGCVLKFEGGCLKNGTLKGSATHISAPACKIFDTTINLISGFVIDAVRPEWFGAIADGIYDCSDVFNKLCKEFRTIKLSQGTYLITKPVTITYCRNIEGNEGGNKYNSVNIKHVPSSSDKTLFYVKNSVPYLTVSGITINGDVQYLTVGNNTEPWFKSGTVCFDIISAGDLHGGNIVLKDVLVRWFEVIVNSNSNSYYNKFIDCTFEYFKTGFKDMSPNNIVFENNHFNRFETAIQIGYGNGPVHISHNSFEAFSGFIVYFKGATQASFTYNYVELYDYWRLPSVLKDNNGGYYGGNILFFGGVKNFIAQGNEYSINGAKNVYYFNNIDTLFSICNRIEMYEGNCNLTAYYSSETGNITNFVCQDYAAKLNPTGTLTEGRYSEIVYSGGVNRVRVNTPYCILGNDPISNKKYITVTSRMDFVINQSVGWKASETDAPKAICLNEGIVLGGIIERDTSVVEAGSHLLTMQGWSLLTFNDTSVKYKTFNTDYVDVVVEFNYKTGKLSVVNGPTDKGIYLDGIVIHSRT